MARMGRMMARAGTEDEDGKSSFAGSVEDLPALPTGPDLHEVLRERAPVLEMLPLGGVLPALRASKVTQALISSAMTIYISFSFRGAAKLTPAEAAEAARRRQHTRARMPQCLANAPEVYMQFHLRDSPLKRKMLNRHLHRVAPTIRWEECRAVRFICRGDCVILDSSLRNFSCAMLRTDVDAFLDEPWLFRNVVRISLSITQLNMLPADASFPQIQRVKVTCRDAVSSEGGLAAVKRTFPNAERVHLELLASALVPLCGPDFEAPRDVRLSLLRDQPDPGNKHARQANFFVASHLLSLPFRWKGKFFSHVVRLQMHELNEQHVGKSIDQIMELLQALPNLRRLGTLSVHAANLLNFIREGCGLEELVVVLEMDEVESMFRIFLPLEKDRRRTRLQRLGVHLLASDGCSKLTLEGEAAICAGWYQIACNHLRPTGYVNFSVSNRQILETVPCQLPWFEPAHFCLDRVEYNLDKLPRSTPLQKQLHYFWPELVDRPSGTLVTGPLRPSAEADREITSATPHGSRDPTRASSTYRRTTAAGASPTARRARDPFADTSSRLPGWLTMQLADAVEILSTTAFWD